jgi:hypothetical protein
VAVDVGFRAVLRSISFVGVELNVQRLAACAGELGARIWMASIEDDFLRESSEFITTDAIRRTSLRDE